MENIAENNKLIAEFMGAKPNKGGEYELYGIIEGIEDGEHEQHFFFGSEMKFSTDWNWLMEVVKNIEKTKIRETHGQFNENEYEAIISISIENTFCQILSNGAFINEIISINGESKIEAVYSACVEFIKWYNANI